MPKGNTPKIDRDNAFTILGEYHSHLIELIAEFAQTKQLTLYMVGGIVRDLLLERRNLDIDFVLESSAVDFTESLSAKFGGNTDVYPIFGTATWTLNESVAEKLDLPINEIPHHLDFVTARSESYEYPTALPTVSPSDIKQDLKRRDFTINSIAIQLSPSSMMWHIIDVSGGVADLENRLIRVLHDLSFIDDSTRILRAIRFSERLNFKIEAHTASLIQSALPMLKRVTGERLQNEITLILREKTPLQAILKCEKLDILVSIHPAFQLTEAIKPAFACLQEKVYPQWSDNIVLLSWHLLMATIPFEEVEDILRRLLFGQNGIKSILATSEALQNPRILLSPDTKPSVLVEYLSKLTDDGLVTLWIYLNKAVTRDRIEQFYHSWRHIKPISDGNTLKAMGLKPSPKFREILAHLRDAWLDDVIHNEAEEQSLLQKLVAEANNDLTS